MIKYLLKSIFLFFIIFLVSACSLFFSKKTKIAEKKQEKIVVQKKKAAVIQKDTVRITPPKAVVEEEKKELENEEEVDLEELYASFENIPDADLPIFSESEIIQQVNALDGNIHIQYNPEIKPYITKFTSKRGRKFLSKVLAYSQLYFPIFDQILTEEGVPRELKYVAVVESALMPNIMSRAGAVGLWQFMRGTGRLYDLKVGYVVDERCDMFKSTRAAARYMKNLYELYGDWLLVLAAYNCGPGNINKAMKRSGGTDFWSIYEKLPKETRRHIPKFIATYYAFYYHKDLMIAPMRDKAKYIDVQRVSIKKPICLEQVAKVLGIEEKELAKLNRHFLSGYIPAIKKSYKLVLPKEFVSAFNENRDSIYNYKRKLFFSKNGKFIGKRKDFYPIYGALGAGKPIVYRVRKGDVFGKIARRFGTSVRNIKNWNGLRSNNIRIGQKLRIYTTAKYRNRKNERVITDFKSDEKNVKLPYLPLEYQYHTIQKNENCWSIAKKYEGVTFEKIVELNKIKNPSALQIGQKLRIKKLK